MVFALEMIGTVAFAISGAVAGIRKGMDLFGVAILAMTAAVGGGILRDILLNITPPAAFREPVYALTAIGTGMIVFVVEAKRLFHRRPKFYETALMWMDSVGLGVFTVVGMQVAYATLPEPNVFLSVFVGVITGVGGGVLRDVLSLELPSIFVRYFYASASLAGALLAAALWSPLGQYAAMLAGAVLVVVLRVLAMRYHWKLPRVKQ